MNTLSLFPSLLSWSELSPLLIRLVLAAVFIHWSYRGLKNPSATAKTKGIALIEGIAGILLVIGLWTQAAALVAIVDLVIRLVERIQKKAFLTDGVNYYLILLVLALSLLVTGAGWYGFDLRL